MRFNYDILDNKWCVVLSVFLSGKGWESYVLVEHETEEEAKVECIKYQTALVAHEWSVVKAAYKGIETFIDYEFLIREATVSGKLNTNRKRGLCSPLTASRIDKCKTETELLRERMNK